MLKGVIELKRVLLVAAVVVVAIINILIYWNQHLYYKSLNSYEINQRIEILEKANFFYPWNDLVYHELGKAHFDLAESNFSARDSAISHINNSIEGFQRSIRINPSNQFSHFYLGRSLAYKELLVPSESSNFLGEYKKAAKLVGHYNEIYYEVVKLMLSRWGVLSDVDKTNTLEMLQKIWRGMDREKIQSLLHIWELQIKDIAIMTQILPDKPEAYRLWAEFLGERSLDVMERQRSLADAERLEFNIARAAFNLGERHLYYYRLKEAFDQFRRCLRTLDKIHFYQNLTSDNLINELEITTLRNTTLLNIAKCQIEARKDWSEIESYLLEYLHNEDSVSNVNDLETYLVERGLLREKLDGRSDDIRRLAFHFFLDFKQHRYTNIVRVGRSLVAFPEEALDHYIRILQIVGDSYQKKGSLYEADYFYRLALDKDSKNLETLLRIRQNLERLNEDAKIRDINIQIQKILSPRSINPGISQIPKRRTFRQELLLDGRDIVLDLRFLVKDNESAPLITIFFNGKVMWEDYLAEEILSIPVETESGSNKIEIIAVNHPVEIIQLNWNFN